MVLHNPWGLLALLSIPAILVLHYFRSRRKVRRIGGIHLWQFAEIRVPIGGKWDRIIRNLPLLLQLLAALLLSLLIAGFDIPNQSDSRHYTIIVDNSISMTAGGDESAAKATVEKLSKWAQARDKFTLIAAGARPQLTAGPFASRIELLDAVEKWKPEESGCDLDAAINLASRFSIASGKILFLTDEMRSMELIEKTLFGDDDKIASEAKKGEKEQDKEKDIIHADALEFQALGHPMENVAISYADRVRVAPGTDRIYITLLSYAEITKPGVVVRVLSGESEIWSKQVDLEPNKATGFTLETAEVDKPLQIVLPDDALLADNTVLLLPVTIKRVRTFIASDLDPVSEFFTKAVKAVQNAELVSDPAMANLVFTSDATFTPGPQNVRVVYLPDAPVVEDMQLAKGLDIVADHSNSISDTLPLEGVLWPFGPTEASGRARTLLSFAERPLLTFLESADGRGRYQLNLLWDRTNIFRETTWPVLIHGIIEETRHAMPGMSRTNFRIGEDVTFRLKPDEMLPLEFALLRDGKPFRSYEALPSVIVDLPAGRYELRQGEALSLGEFAVNLFAPNESDLRTLSSHEADFEQLVPESLRQTETNRVLFYAFLILLIAMAAGSWILEDTSR